MKENMVKHPDTVPLPVVIFKYWFRVLQGNSLLVVFYICRRYFYRNDKSNLITIDELLDNINLDEMEIRSAASTLDVKGILKYNPEKEDSYFIDFESLFRKTMENKEED